MRADGQAAQQLSDPQPRAGVVYDAFISYDHDDRAVAQGIQRGLHRIGKRIGQLRALRVFRDSTDLSASPNLWGKVTDALRRSRYMIVVLSRTRWRRSGSTRRSAIGLRSVGRSGCCSWWQAARLPGMKPPSGLILIVRMRRCRC